MPTESGDNKLLGNFRKLVELVSGDPNYNPANAAITRAGLQSLATESQAAVVDVGANEAPYKVAVNERQTEFEDVPRRMGNAFRMAKASGASKKIQDDLTSARRKLTGQRKSKVVKDDPNTPEDEAVKTHSVSQLSYENLVGNSQNFLALLAGITSYAPNEDELKISSLQAFVAGLQAKNDAVNAAFVPLSQARGKRDQLLYLNDNCVVNTALLVKAYVSAAFGSQSQLYKAIKPLKFERKRRI